MDGATDDSAGLTGAKRSLGEMADNPNPETSESKRWKPDPGSPDIISLDPEGDVILAFKKTDAETQIKYLASSKVLSLASPVFRALFSPAFSEGDRVRKGEVPCIEFPEDDAEAMDVILRILHYSSKGVPFDVAPEPLAAIAIHRDKYDCGKALTVWVRHWLNAKSFTGLSIESLPESIGFTVVAAYKFRCRAAFLSTVASRASKFLRLDFRAAWEQQPVMALLPETFAASLYDHIMNTLGRLRTAILSVDKTLQQRSKGYNIPDQLICPQCDLVFTGRKRKKECACGRFAIERFCTVELRVAEYFALLRQHGLYPPEEPFSTLSVRQVCDKIEGMVLHNNHNCDGGFACPLLMALFKLREDAEATSTALDFVWTWN